MTETELHASLQAQEVERTVVYQHNEIVRLREALRDRKTALDDLIGYCCTVRLDRRVFRDDTLCTWQTLDWCHGLLDEAKKAALTVKDEPPRSTPL